MQSRKFRKESYRIFQTNRYFLFLEDYSMLKLKLLTFNWSKYKLVVYFIEFLYAFFDIKRHRKKHTERERYIDIHLHIYEDTSKDPYKTRYIRTHNTYNVRNVHNTLKIENNYYKLFKDFIKMNHYDCFKKKIYSIAVFWRKL